MIDVRKSKRSEMATLRASLIDAKKRVDRFKAFEVTSREIIDESVKAKTRRRYSVEMSRYTMKADVAMRRLKTERDALATRRRENKERRDMLRELESDTETRSRALQRSKSVREEDALSLMSADKERRKKLSDRQRHKRNEIRSTHEETMARLRRDRLREEQIVAVRAADAEDRVARAARVRSYQEAEERRVVSNAIDKLLLACHGEKRERDDVDELVEDPHASASAPVSASRLEIIAWLVQVGHLREAEAETLIETESYESLLDLRRMTVPCIRSAMLSTSRHVPSIANEDSPSNLDAAKRSEETLQRRVRSLSDAARHVARGRRERVDIERTLRRLLDRLSSEKSNDASVANKRSMWTTLRSRLVRMKSAYVQYKTRRTRVARRLKIELSNALNDLARGIVAFEETAATRKGVSRRRLETRRLFPVLRLYASTCERDRFRSVRAPSLRRDAKSEVVEENVRRYDACELVLSLNPHDRARLVAHVADVMSRVSPGKCEATGSGIVACGRRENVFSVHVRSIDGTPVDVRVPEDLRRRSGIDRDVLANALLVISFRCGEAEVKLPPDIDLSVSHENHHSIVVCRYGNVSVAPGDLDVFLHVTIGGVPIGHSPFRVRRTGSTK